MYRMLIVSLCVLAGACATSSKNEQTRLPRSTRLCLSTDTNDLWAIQSGLPPAAIEAVSKRIEMYVEKYLKSDGITAVPKSSCTTEDAVLIIKLTTFEATSKRRPGFGLIGRSSVVWSDPSTEYRTRIIFDLLITSPTGVKLYDYNGAQKEGASLDKLSRAIADFIGKEAESIYSNN